MLSLSLTFGLLLAAPESACPVEVVAARVEALAPSLGRATPTFEDGVVALEFSRDGEGPVALLALQLVDDQFSTVGTAPRAADMREVLNGLGPELIADEALLAALAKCPVGSTTAQAKANAWEVALRERERPPEPEPAAVASEHPEVDAQREHPTPHREDRDPASENPEQRPSWGRVWRTQPRVTLAYGAVAVLLTLLGIFWRRRESE